MKRRAEAKEEREEAARREREREERARPRRSDDGGENPEFEEERTYSKAELELACRPLKDGRQVMLHLMALQDIQKGASRCPKCAKTFARKDKYGYCAFMCQNPDCRTNLTWFCGWCLGALGGNSANNREAIREHVLNCGQSLQHGQHEGWDLLRKRKWKEDGEKYLELECRDDEPLRNAVLAKARELGIGPPGMFDLGSGGQVVNAPEIRKMLGHEQEVWGVSVTADGKRAASAGGGDKTVRIWSVPGGKEIRKIEVPGVKNVWCVAMSPDGDRVLTGASDGHVRLWNAHTGEEVRRFDGPHGANVLCVCFNEDGTQALSGSDCGSAWLWDVATGAELRRFEGHDGPVRSVACSTLVGKVVTGSDDGSVRVWKTADGKEVHKMDGHGTFRVLGQTETRVTSVAISPDGSKVASGGVDRSVRLWSVVDGQEICKMEGHEDWVRSVAFFGDGSSVVSGGDDNTLRLWNVTSGTEVMKLEGHWGDVSSVAVAEGEGATRIVSGSWDKSVRVWQVIFDEDLAEESDSEVDPDSPSRGGSSGED